MVKPREKRVPIMMSEDEMKAIDDWRFANHVATRSEAIRRLCRIALILDENLSELIKGMAKIDRRAGRFVNNLAAVKRSTEIRRYERLERVASEFADLNFIEVGDLLVTLEQIVRQSISLTTKTDFDDALASAEKEKTELVELAKNLETAREQKDKRRKKLAMIDFSGLAQVAKDAADGAESDAVESAVEEAIAQWKKENGITKED